MMSVGCGIVRIACFQILSAVLSTRDQEMRVEVVRWEMAAPHRVTTGHANDEFVERARGSHLLVALLLDEIRPGTLEELKSVLGMTSGPEVAVLCFESSRPRSSALKDFLSSNKNRIIYKEAGALDSDEAWYEISRLVVDFAVRLMSMRESQGTYVDAF